MPYKHATKFFVINPYLIAPYYIYCNESVIINLLLLVKKADFLSLKSL